MSGTINNNYFSRVYTSNGAKIITQEALIQNTIETSNNKFIIVINCSNGSSVDLGFTISNDNDEPIHYLDKYKGLTGYFVIDNMIAVSTIAILVSGASTENPVTIYFNTI